MERKHLVRDARDDAVLLVVGHPGPAALRRLRRDGREVEHRVRERRVHEPADGLARQGPHDADGVRVRAVGLLAEAEARAVLEACVEYNFSGAPRGFFPHRGKPESQSALYMASWLIST